VSVLTPAGLLREGNAITNGAFSVCFMLGPVLGGVVVAVGHTGAALLIDAALFALMAVSLLTATGLPAVPDEGAPAAGRLRSALAHALGEPAIRGLIVLQAASLLFFMMSMPVEVVFAQHTLHAGAGGYGAMLSAWGAGAVIGSAVYARWRALPASTLLTLGSAAVGLGLVAMGAAPSLALVLPGAVVGGIGNGIAAVASRTALQEQVHGQWMARIMSLWEALNEAVPGGGIVLGGATAALAGPRAAMIVAGFGGLIVSAFVPVVLRSMPDVERAVAP
jgi:hypothetical protein